MEINNLSIAFFIVFILNLSLGIFVYLKGKKKLSNKIYSIFSFQLAFWSFISFLIASTKNTEKAILLIKFVFTYSSFIPSTFYLFAVSIGEEVFPKKELRKALLFFILSIINGLICFSPNFVLECFIPLEKRKITSGPVVKYGKPEILIFTLNILIILGYSLYYLYKKKKEKSGIIALEIHYVFLAFLFGTIYNVSLSLLPLLFTEITFTDRLGPFASVVVSSVIIYGIAKYKIMDIVLVYEAISLYLILSSVLFIIYFISFQTLNFLFFFLGFSSGQLPIILSSFLVALLFSPLREYLRKFLRLKVLKFDIEIFTQKAFETLFSFSSPKEIFNNLKVLLSDFLNIPQDILFLFKEKSDFPFEEEDLPIGVKVLFENDSLFFDNLKNRKIIIREEEKRVEMIYPEKKKIVKEFEKIGYDVAISIEQKGNIKGAFFLKRKLDGSIFSYRDQLLLLNLGYQIGLSIENITLYHKISETNIYIKNLLDNSPFGVISLDKDGRINLVNKQIEIFLEKDENELIGKNFSEVLPFQVVSLIKKKYEKFDKEIIIDEIIYQKGNRDYIFHVNIVPFFDEQGEKIGLIVILSDVTKVKQLEEEIKEKEKLASLGIMAAGIAHEIRNPLVAIKTFAELFPVKYNDSEFRERYANILNEEINRINNLVEDILLFAKPQILKIEQINLIELLNSTLSLLNFQFSDKRLKIIKKLPQKDVIIKGDREKLREVFINVLMNSYEAIDDKEGIVDITLNENRDEVEIIISDNGCGIKKENMNKIFDPFFTTKKRGTGLGLSIVLRIIESHRGKIKIESEEAKGTKVYIYLPKKGN